jgi:predicted nucleic-acid-binding protein
MTELAEITVLVNIVYPQELFLIEDKGHTQKKKKKIFVNMNKIPKIIVGEQQILELTLFTTIARTKSFEYIPNFETLLDNKEYSLENIISAVFGYESNIKEKI